MNRSGSTRMPLVQRVILPESVSSSKRRRLAREILTFLLSGGVAAAVNLTTGVIVRSAFGLRLHAAAVAAGFVTGTVVSFLLNRELTFRARRDKVGVQLTKFLLLAGIGIALAALTAELAFRGAVALFGDSISERLLANGAHLFAIGTSTISNFLGMKYFALRK